MRLHGRIVGEITIFMIVRGALQSATVGYWVDAAMRGQGIAGARVVPPIVPVARDDLGPPPA